MGGEMHSPSPAAHNDLGTIPRVRHRAPSVDSSEMRKRRRGSPNHGVDTRRGSHSGSSTRDPMATLGYGNGYPTPPSTALHGRPSGSPGGQNKSRRLYVGNIPTNAGLSDMALKQFFSTLYHVGFQKLRPGESLPVVSAWMHSDGKFAFMELRGDQEAVNMMLFSGVCLHGRALRINRPSDFKPENSNPNIASLRPDAVDAASVIELVKQLDGIVSIPDELRSSLEKNRTGERAESNLNPSIKVENGDKHDGSIHGTRSSREISPVAGRTNGHSTTAVGMETKSEISMESKSEYGHGTKRGNSRNFAGAENTGNVISLVNLVTTEDLEGPDDEYEDLVDDVKTECGQYGEVRSVEVPRNGPWKGTAFIEFTKKEYASLAVKELSKRVFDNRLISAETVAGCSTARAALARSHPSSR